MASFPFKLDEITPRWVADALGVSEEAINSFTLVVPEDNPGLASEIGFIKLSSKSQEVPSSIMVKVPPDYPDAAELIRKVGAFRREATFYKHLASETPVRTPAIYAVDMDDESGNAIMLLEDCSQMKRLSLLDDPPVTREELLSIVRTAAKLHGHWWNRGDELRSYDVIMHRGHDVWRQFLVDTEAGFGKWLGTDLGQYAPHGTVPVVERLQREYREFVLANWPTTNLTLCHMDFHLQNLFLDESRPEDPVVVFDWDGCSVGPGANDIAYLLSLLPVELRRREENDLLKAYYDELIQSGVQDYAFEQLQADYQFASLFNSFIVPMALKLDTSSDDSANLVLGVTHGIFSNLLDHEAHLLLDQ